MNNIVVIYVTTNYPTAFTAGNTKIEYMARGFKKFVPSVKQNNKQ